MKKVLFSAALLASIAPNAFADNLHIKEIGSFHIGGEAVTLAGLPTRETAFSPGSVPFKVDPNGDYQTGQMYVQFIKLADPKAKYPLLLWHGGGLTGVSWETKPDGAPGFQNYFLNAGHDVYVSDSAERGRASFSRSPEIYKTEPQFRTLNEAWTLFRIGPEGSYKTKNTFGGVQFPIESVEQFGKQMVPRWLDSNEMIQSAYDALVDKICPCVVMTHSQAGLFGFQAALRSPDKIKALISIEPGTPPKIDSVNPAIKDVPMLVIWGDNIDKSDYWTKKVPAIASFTDQLKSAGTNVTWVDLPKAGISGNSHMVMMDKNSDQVADLIQDWLRDNELAEK